MHAVAIVNVMQSAISSAPGESLQEMPNHNVQDVHDVDGLQQPAQEDDSVQLRQPAQDDDSLQLRQPEFSHRTAYCKENGTFPHDSHIFLAEKKRDLPTMDVS